MLAYLLDLLFYPAMSGARGAEPLTRGKKHFSIDCCLSSIGDSAKFFDDFADRAGRRWNVAQNDDVPCSKVILSHRRSDEGSVHRLNGFNFERASNPPSSNSNSGSGSSSWDGRQRLATSGGVSTSRFLRADSKNALKEKDANPIASCEDKLEKLKKLLGPRKGRGAKIPEVSSESSPPAETFDSESSRSKPETTLSELTESPPTETTVSELPESKPEATVSQLSAPAAIETDKLPTNEASPPKLLDSTNNVREESAPKSCDVVDYATAFSRTDSFDAKIDDIITVDEYEDEYDENDILSLKKTKKPKKHRKSANDHSNKKKEDKQTDEKNQTNISEKAKHRKNKKRSKKIKEQDIVTKQHDRETPIYFCPETSKLFVTRKYQKKSKRKPDCWLKNLVDKVVPYLNKSTPLAIRKAVPENFDEIKGKFCNGNPSDSESADDTFTVVFSDASPKKRDQRVSECDSEDSFVICFESDCDSVDANANCFISDDLNCDSWESFDTSDDDSDDETTLKVPVLKGCLKKLRSRETSPNSQTNICKKVSFDPAPARVHQIIAWKYAYHQARIGPWQGYARDTERFKQRIIDMSVSLDWVLKREHRSRVYFQRFRPIYMRQLREEREAKKREAERVKREELELLEKEREEEEERIKKVEEEAILKKVEEEDECVKTAVECVVEIDEVDCKMNEKSDLFEEKITTTTVEEYPCKDVQHKCESKELIQVN